MAGSLGVIVTVPRKTLSDPPSQYSVTWCNGVKPLSTNSRKFLRIVSRPFQSATPRLQIASSAKQLNPSPKVLLSISFQKARSHSGAWVFVKLRVSMKVLLVLEGLRGSVPLEEGRNGSDREHIGQDARFNSLSGNRKSASCRRLSPRRSPIVAQGTPPQPLGHPVIVALSIFSDGFAKGQLRKRPPKRRPFRKATGRSDQRLSACRFASRAASLMSPAARWASPFALSTLPSACISLSPVIFPAASFTAPLALSAAPLICSLSTILSSTV